MTETLQLPHKVEYVELFESEGRHESMTGDYTQCGLGRVTDFAKVLADFCETHELRHLDIRSNQAGTYCAEVYGYIKRR